MNTLEKYAPSFNGKGATERLDCWNALLSQNDFAALLESHESAFATYIAALRKAEIFEKCADASGVLKQLKAFLCWNEDYSVDYCVLASLSCCCKDVDELVAHSSHKEWVERVGLSMNSINGAVETSLIAKCVIHGEKRIMVMCISLAFLL